MLQGGECKRGRCRWPRIPIFSPLMHISANLGPKLHIKWWLILFFGLSDVTWREGAKTKNEKILHEGSKISNFRVTYFLNSPLRKRLIRGNDSFGVAKKLFSGNNVRDADKCLSIVNICFANGFTKECITLNSYENHQMSITRAPLPKRRNEFDSRYLSEYCTVGLVRCRISEYDSLEYPG